jgi:HBS1 N-terminus
MLETRLNEVRRLLGDHHDIPDKEIRETLWYYYFDLEKSVEWLLGILVSQSHVKSVREIYRFGEAQPCEIDESVN